MATCTEGIAKDITSTCLTQPIGGTEVKAWMMNRSDISTITYDVTDTTLVTAIVMKATKKAYTLTGVKNLLNPGSSLVTADDRANRWIHSFNFQGFQFDSASQQNLDSLADIVVIVEMKNKLADNATFRIYGLTNGMYPSSDEFTANDIDGARAITLESLATAPEPASKNNFYITSYAASLAALVALETAPG